MHIFGVVYPGGSTVHSNGGFHFGNQQKNELVDHGGVFMYHWFPHWNRLHYSGM
jgi:hypothetical protein